MPIRAFAACAFSSLRAASTTSYPAFANTSAIPDPMVPEPATPTERTVRPGVALTPSSGVSASRTTVAEPGAS